ncbi:MAG: helix-turn-helix domain-containing protein [Clostridium sp.]|nr:helix-turn-helix domain-containing protein [Clostridium sp.]
MIYIQTLLDYLKSLKISYTGDFSTQLEIRSIEILNEKSIVAENTLYISYDDETVLKFISSDEYPAHKCCIILLSKTKINNKNLCQIITENTFEYMFNLISNFIFEHFSLSLKQNYIYDSLYGADTMEDILNIGEKYLYNPIFLLDTSYALLCRSNMAETQNSCIDKHNERYYLKFNIVNLMKKHKCIDTIYNSSKPFFHYDEDKIIFCSVKVNNITTAYICVLEVNHKFSNSDLELVETLSKVIAAFSEKDHIFISNSGLCDEYYLIDLLSNKFDNIDYIKNRLDSSRFELKENFLLVSIPFMQEFKDYRYNFGLRELMQSGKNILGNCLSAYYENNIHFLVSSSDFDVITYNMKYQLIDFLKLNKLKCGMSFVFNDLNNIHDYMQQSVQTVKLSSKFNYDGFIFNFEDFLDYYLFSTADSKNSFEKINLKTLIHPYITKLIKYDAENNSELFKTFKAYLENNKNSIITAQTLNINRSTFFYRFHKIEKILNIDINSYSYKLKVALQLYNYINKNY